MRITHKDTKNMFESTVEAAKGAGIEDADKWVLYLGQSFYSLVTIDEGTKGHRSLVSYIGNTAAEAYEFLSNMRTAFFLVPSPKN